MSVDPEKVLTAIAAGSAFAVSLWAKFSKSREAQHTVDDGQSKRIDELGALVRTTRGEVDAVANRVLQLELERGQYVRREEWKTLDDMARKAFKQILAGQSRIARRLKGPTP